MYWHSRRAVAVDGPDHGDSGDNSNSSSSSSSSNVGKASSSSNGSIKTQTIYGAWLDNSSESWTSAPRSEWSPSGDSISSLKKGTQHTIMEATTSSEAAWDQFGEFHDIFGDASNDTVYDSSIDDMLLNHELTEDDLAPDVLPQPIITLFIVCFVIIILLSVAGNSMVILVVTCNRKMRTVTNTFLVSLAVSDLLIASLNMPFQLLFHVRHEWTLGEFVCKFSKYVQGVVIMVSILTLTGIAVDRFYAICHPLRARHMLTIRRSTLFITAFWLTSFLLVSPQLVIQRLGHLLHLRPEQDPPISIVTVCVEDFHNHWGLEVAYTVFFYALYLIPVIVMCGTYGLIAAKLWRRRPIGEIVDDPSDGVRRLREKKRIVCMLITIMALFAISWFPFFTSTVYLLFHFDVMKTNSFRIMYAFFQLLGYSNSCVNPIIYCFLNSSFQQHFYKTLFCCKCLAWRIRRPSWRRSFESTPINSHTTHTTPGSTML